MKLRLNKFQQNNKYILFIFLETVAAKAQKNPFHVLK